MKTRPMYWSIRREVWENRSIYIVPLIVGGVMLLGFFLSSFTLPARRRAALALDQAHQRLLISKPYDIAAMMFVFAMVIVAIFFCLDALHGEQRDRSILFWKSLPVSDRTAVLSKLSIPVVVLPAITLVATIVTQMLMLLWSSFVLLVSGLTPVTTFQYFNIVLHSIFLFYGLIVIALWHAPLYAWLLLVSAWAKRATFLWAILPFFAIGILERIAFNTTYFGKFLQYRLGGGFHRAFAFRKDGTIDALSDLTPGKFLVTPGLWIGLAFAAAFIAGAVRLRRYREPI